MESEAMLEVVLFGHVGFRLPSGEVAELRGARETSLLSWLALPPHPEAFHSREVIGEQLWPSQSPKAIEEALGQALTAVRKVLRSFDAEEHLRGGGDHRSQIGLLRVDSDLARFRALRDLGDLDLAIEAASGIPLGHLGRRPTAWAETTQRALIEEVDDVFASYGTHLEGESDCKGALAVHEQRLRLDEASQDAMRGVMRCNAGLGRPKLAMSAFRQHLAVVAEASLEVETLELKQAIESSLPERSGVFRKAAATEYAPTTTYPGTRAFDPGFNGDLMEDLAESNSYIFRGISAKYVPGRVRMRGPGLDLVRVLTLDPEAGEAIRLRALDRAHNPKYAGKSPAALQAELEHEIAVALVSLFDCRHLCAIDIGCVASTAVDRVELFDDALYVSLYHGPRAEGFPETMRYARGSVAYGQHRLNCVREFELARRRILFRADQDSDHLVAVLAESGIDVAEADIATYRLEAEEFTANFMGQLRTMEVR